MSVRKYTLSICIGTLLCCLVTSASAAEPATAESDLATIMEWWNGDYDNNRQVARLEAADEAVWRADDSGKGGHIEVTSHYRPVNLPAFGENVIYVEESKHRDPTNIFRQRIYTLKIDEELGVIRVKLWSFKDKERYVGAWTQLDRLDDLLPEDMGPLPDKCDLTVSRQGDKFHMPMAQKDCAFGESHFNYQVLLGEDSFWFRDKIVRTQDDVITSTAGNFTYHELDKLDSCSLNANSPRCILGLAESTLASMTSDADRILATVELAEAYAVSDRNADAVAILASARTLADVIEDDTAAVGALAEIAHGFVAAGKSQMALDTVDAGEVRVVKIDDAHKRQDLKVKLLSMRAAAGEVGDALAGLTVLPHDDETLAAYKARGMMEVAVLQAKQKDFDGAELTLSGMNVGLTYYRVKGLADVARLVLLAGDSSRGLRMLEEATTLAETIENGYFSAPTMRDIAYAWDQGAGEEEIALAFDERALEEARRADTPEERARAISRLATRVADAGRYALGDSLIPEAIKFAREEPTEAKRNYAFYEVSGSAAFCGDFETARLLLAEIPDVPMGKTASIFSATQRDIAWGLARHGNLGEAVLLAWEISTPREKVQALSRIVRLLADPKMQAYPRYL